MNSDPHPFAHAGSVVGEVEPGGRADDVRALAAAVKADGGDGPARALAHRHGPADRRQRHRTDDPGLRQTWSTPSLRWRETSSVGRRRYRFALAPWDETKRPTAPNPISAPPGAGSQED